MIKLAKLILEIKQIGSPIVKVTDKTYVEWPEKFNKFIESHCSFEMGGGSEEYDKPVSEVLKDFKEGKIHFSEDYIQPPPEDKEDDTWWGLGSWDEENLVLFEEIKNYLGDNHYSIFGSEDINGSLFIQYNSDENRINFWGNIMDGDGDEEDLSHFDKNGNIVFDMSKIDHNAF